MKVFAVVLIGCFVLFAALTTFEGGVTVLFGWFPFLQRVLPNVSGDRLNVTVSIVALVLFAAGVHWLGWSWRRRSEPATDRAWKLRWTVSIVATVFLLFTAGISAVGIVHQSGWLFGSDAPMMGAAIRGYEHSRVNAMKQIGLATLNYHDVTKGFPPGGSFTAEGEMLHSWITYTLPYGGYTTQGIDMNRSWRDPVNEKYFKSILPEFINPGFRTAELEDREGFGLSHYAANSRVMGPNTKMRVEAIADGASNTLLIGEVNAEFKPWGHPLSYRDPALGLNRSPRGFGGSDSNGAVMFVMADGSVRPIGDRISPAVLKALSTPNGGEKIKDVDD